jgi:hypothetical protein
VSIIFIDGDVAVIFLATFGYGKFIWSFQFRYSNFSNTVIRIHVSNVVKSSYAKDIRINFPHLKHVFI